MITNKQPVLGITYQRIFRIKQIARPGNFITEATNTKKTIAWSK
jgi:hypothetical protein